MVLNHCNMVAISESCKLCSSEENPTSPILEFLNGGNRTIPIKFVNLEDTFDNRVCHHCIFDIALLDDLVNKYKNISPIHDPNSCYLCFKEECTFIITAELYNPIRVIEECFLIKNIISSEFESDEWKIIRKRLQNKKMCNECYFLIDSCNNLFQRVKRFDDEIKTGILRVKSFMEGVEESSSSEENNNDEFDTDSDDLEAESEGFDEEEEIEENFESKKSVFVKTEVKTEIDSDVSNLTDYADDEEIDQHAIIRRIKEEPVDLDNDGVDIKEETKLGENVIRLSSDSTGNGSPAFENINMKEECHDDIQDETRELQEEDLKARTKSRKSNKKNRKTETEENVPSLKKNGIKHKTSNNDNGVTQQISKSKSVNETTDKTTKLNVPEIQVKIEPEETDFDMERSQSECFVPTTDGIEVNEENRTETLCSWCLKTLPCNFNNSLCITCSDKCKVSMAGIQSGRTCHIVLHDLKSTKDYKGLQKTDDFEDEDSNCHTNLQCLQEEDVGKKRKRSEPANEFECSDSGWCSSQENFNYSKRSKCDSNKSDAVTCENQSTSNPDVSERNHHQNISTSLSESSEEILEEKSEKRSSDAVGTACGTETDPGSNELHYRQMNKNTSEIDEFENLNCNRTSSDNEQCFSSSGLDVADENTNEYALNSNTEQKGSVNKEDRVTSLENSEETVCDQGPNYNLGTFCDEAGQVSEKRNNEGVYSFVASCDNDDSTKK